MVKLDYPSPFCCKIVLRALKASVSGDYIWQSFIIFLITSSTIPLVRGDTILLEGKRVALTQKMNAVAQCRSAGINVGSLTSSETT